jgi:hypothetical protein
VTRTTTTRLIIEQFPNLNYRKRNRRGACFEFKAVIGNNSYHLLFIFEEINALKRQLQLKPEKTANSKKRNKEG